MTQGNVENEEQPSTSQQSCRKMSSSSSIEQLVEQEEMKGTQMEAEEDEPTQIVEDSLKQDEDGAHQINSNAIMEYDDDESISGIEVSNPYSAKGETDVSDLQIADKHRPCNRWGHTMTLIDDNKALIYGGQAFDEKEKKFSTLADLHVYDMNKKAWSKPINCEGMPRCWVSEVKIC